MRILFSPIGSTDPVSNCHDGGMLHICRVYKPDKVYLYLSGEMCFYEDLDRRYTKSVELLSDELGKQIETVTIRDEKMKEVQIFDSFIDKFEGYIDHIIEQDKPDEMYVNISSGIPAMKSSLQMISILWGNVYAVQVVTPAKKSNDKHEDKEDYDLEIQWECNDDRKPDYENRCTLSHAKRLLDRIRKENIANYIKNFDYMAAELESLQFSNPLSEQFLNCLKIAIERKKLNINYINSHRKQCRVDDWFPLKNGREMKEFEYLLNMQVKLWNREYVDFVRDLTPVFASLTERLFESKCKINLDDICVKAGKSKKISADKLKKFGVNISFNGSDTAYISSRILMDIIETSDLKSDVQELDLMKDIRCVEREVRNLAAHEIISVSPEWIEKKTSFSPDRIMTLLFKYARLAGIPITKESCNIYKKMNEDLLNMLYEVDTMSAV